MYFLSPSQKLYPEHRFKNLFMEDRFNNIFEQINLYTRNPHPILDIHNII